MKAKWWIDRFAECRPTEPSPRVETPPLSAIKISAPADVVWTSQNYPDFKNKMFGPADTVAMDKAIHAAL